MGTWQGDAAGPAGIPDRPRFHGPGPGVRAADEDGGRGAWATARGGQARLRQGPARLTTRSRQSRIPDRPGIRD